MFSLYKLHVQTLSSKVLCVKKKSRYVFAKKRRFVFCYSVGRPNFCQNVPKRFAGQLIRKTLVTKTNLCVLFKFSGTRVLEVVIVHCQKFFLDQARVLNPLRFGETNGWDHKSTQCKSELVIYSFCSKKTKNRLNIIQADGWYSTAMSKEMTRKCLLK